LLALVNANYNVDIGANGAGSDGKVFGETDLKEAFEEDGAGLHTAQPDNFGGFMEALFLFRSTGYKN